MQRIQAGASRSGQPVKRGTMAHDHDLYTTLTDTATQMRDGDAIRRYAPRLEELARRDNHQLYLAIADRAWGVAHVLADEHEQAERRLKHAVEIFTSLGTRWQLARTLTELGELEEARQNPAAARDYFERALSEFDALHATPDAARVRERVVR